MIYDNLPGHISIHALRGEGDASADCVGGSPWISIHALRGEGDPYNQRLLHTGKISIHALRGEGDGRFG